MELLNPSFVILLAKLTFCLLPGIIGIYFMSISEERKRELRNKFCDRIFGVSNAILFPTFERALLIIGLLGFLFTGVTTWFFVIAGMLS